MFSSSSSSSSSLPGDDHGLVHPEGGEQEVGGLGEEHQQRQHEGGHREHGGHPDGAGELKRYINNKKCERHFCSETITATCRNR